MSDFVPKLIALDIDGTIIEWVDGSGVSGVAGEMIKPAVRDAIHRAYDAGAHIVLASGRSPHSMAAVADFLELPKDGDDRLWIVAANGAVIFRYPPVDVVHEETFDARPAVETMLTEFPEAVIAVEERGIGYRVSGEFPPGELSGAQTVASLDELLSEPVSRVIVRDPSSSADDFLAVSSRLGLHGISYVVGWTAWLDLAPVGISKASGLAYVCDQLDLEPSDVLAIGDGRNDIEMIEWAGRGVAMGQSLDVLKDVADAVTESVDNDGAAVEIGLWF